MLIMLLTMDILVTCLILLRVCPAGSSAYAPRIRRLAGLTAAVVLLCAAPVKAEEPLVSPLACVQMPTMDGSEPIPLYCGPTQGFYRHGEQTLDLSQPYVLFGYSDCWAMAAQGTPEAFGPVGYVEAAALPLDESAPVLAFEDALPAMIEDDAPATDNPLAVDPYLNWSITLPRGEQVIVLAALDDWLYVQCEIGNAPARVFVPAACVL